MNIRTSEHVQLVMHGSENGQKQIFLLPIRHAYSCTYKDNADIEYCLYTLL